MSIVLVQEFVSSNEACIKWTVDVDTILIQSSTKGFLYITDVSQFDQTVINGTSISSTTSFPIQKYQLRYNELSNGSVIFENLKVGSYVCELAIINGTVVNTSEPLEVQVIYLAKPIFSDVIEGNQKFTIVLEGPTSPVKNVTFILLGKLISGGVTQSYVANTETVVIDYAINNTYVITQIVNNNTYELACFYTNCNGISSAISDTLVETPTDTPNQITVVDVVLDSTSQLIRISHNLPNNAADYDLVDCRVTITDSNNNVTYFYASQNTWSLNPASDTIFINMNNQNVLPIDVPFTVTLSVKNEIGDWGPVESPAVYCIHPQNFCAVSLLTEDLSYSVGLNSIAITDNMIYSKNSVYTINYTASLFLCDVQGFPIDTNAKYQPIYIQTITQDNLNFNFSGLVTGSKYKAIFYANYTYTFPDSTSIVIGQQQNNTCFYYFIPHDIPNQLSLTASSNNLSVDVSWSEPELKGFSLSRYEVSTDNASWTSNDTQTTYNFDQLTNGTEYTFYVRAVSVSGWSKYMNTDLVLSSMANIIAIPFGQPAQPINLSTGPGDGTCYITWELDVDPYNGGEFKEFRLNIEMVETVISPFFDPMTNKYSYNIIGLSNDHAPNISLVIVTKSKSTINDNSLDHSTLIAITTTPFVLPSKPTNLTGSPDTNSVQLNWDAVVPPTILGNNVEYELYYKLQTDSDFTTVSNITTNSQLVTGLTSNVFYDFKIRSTILNSEIGSYYYSDFTDIISSRPFIYTNAPVMTLGASHNTITVKLSPNTSNYFQTKFNYYATLTLSDPAGNLTLTNSAITDVTDIAEQTITFTMLGEVNLVDLTSYKIVAKYEMFNSDLDTGSDHPSRYYLSNSISNDIKPYNSSLAPVLSSVSKNQSVQLTWDISSLAGYEITEYQLSIDGGAYNVIANISQISQGLTALISTLQNGTSYAFNMRAKILQNAVDIFSTVSNTVTNIPYTKPEVPTNIQTNPGNEQVTLSWSAPNNLNGLGLDHYEVMRSSGNGWTQVGADLSYTFTGLTNGQSYNFNVRTVTVDALEGNALILSDSSSNKVNIPYVKASAPVFSNAVQENASVTYVWNFDNLGGLALDHYEISRDNITWNSNNMSTSYKISNLENGVDVPIYVRAVTIHLYLVDLVIGDTYTPTALMPYTNASAVTVTCVEKNHELDFTWSDPTDLGGLLLDSYEVSAQSSTSWKNIGLVYSYKMIEVIQYNVDDDTTSTQLINGKVYDFMVRAITKLPVLVKITGDIYLNGTIYGLDNGNSNQYSSMGPNNSPTFNSCVEQNSQLKFDWNAIVSDLFNIQPLNSYQVSCDNINWTTVASSVLSYTFDGLVNGSKYTLYVRGVGTHPTLGSILGQILTTVDQYVPYALADVPTFTSCDEQDGKLVFAWTEPANLGGLSLDSYRVSCDNVNWATVNKNTLSYTFNNLVNGSAYTLQVRAVTTGSHVDPVLGQIFATVGQFVPYHIPSAPTLNNVIIMTPNVVVNADSDLHGLVLDHYEVSIDGITFVSVPINNDTVSSADANFVYVVGTAYLFQFRAITTHPNLGECVGDIYSVNATCYTSEAGNYPINVETEASDGQVILTWEPAVQVAGLPFDHYAVGIDTGSIDWIQVGTDQDNMQTSYTFKNLINGDRYTFVIKSVYNDQYAPGITDTYDAAYISSDIWSVDDEPYTQPDLIVDMVATPGSDGYVNFSWSNASLFMGGLPFNKYQYSTDDSTWIDLSVSNVRLAGTLGDLLTVYVRNVTLQMDQNLIYGISRSVSNTAYEVPSVTHGYNTVATDGQVVFSWDQATEIERKGLPLDHYEVSLDQGASWLVSDLNTSYTFQVSNGYAGNKFLSRTVTKHPDLLVGLVNGADDFTSYATGVAYVKPGAVTNIKASAVNELLVFSFTPSADVNNSALTQNFEYSLDGFVTVNPLGQLTSQQIAIGNNVFQLSIRCYIVNPNDNVTHVLSNVTISADLKNIYISTPQNLQATVENGKVILSWNEVLGYSYQVIRYALLDGTIAVRENITTPSYTFSNLVNGTVYQFSVSILVNGQAGSVSNISATPVAVPSIISVTKSGDNLNLNIDFGGASKVQIDVGAFVISNDVIVGIARHLDVVYSSTVNPISISGMSLYTYFNITVSNIIGSVSQANQI